MQSRFVIFLVEVFISYSECQPQVWCTQCINFFVSDHIQQKKPETSFILNDEWQFHQTESEQNRHTATPNLLAHPHQQETHFNQFS